MPRADHSRGALIRSTGQLLRQQGYAATGLSQITADSGASIGSLYHHFPGGKEQLAEAALDTTASAVSTQLQQLLDSETDIASIVQTWLKALGAALQADERDGCPVAPTALESVAANPRLRAAAARAFVDWHRLLARRLRRDGWSRSAAETDANAVLSLVEGALLLARTSGTTAPLTAAARALNRILTPPTAKA